MEGKKFSSSKRVVIYVRDMLARYQVDAFRYFVAAAGPGEPGRRLHLGGVRAADQRRAGRRLGQPGQPDRDADRQELRRDPRGRRARPRPTRRCSTASTQGFARRRRPDRPAPAEAGDRRGDARRRRGQQVRLRLRAVEAQGRRPARAARHDPARHGAGGQRLQHDAVAVPAALGQRGAPRARRRRRAPADAAHRGGRRPRRRRRLPGHHRRLHRRARLGAATRSWSGTPVAKPTPIFTKLDPSVVDEELARLGAQA